MRKSIFLGLALLGAACSPNVETRGALEDPDWDKQIVSGSSTRDDVVRVLGTPSAKSSFGQETWYYITERKESLAFFKPEVADQHVTRVTFDDSGTVKTVDNFGKEQARDITIASRVTPTEG
ncbi:MAG: outer membrane protein assembly factor BamE, partial [Alphaproteobacteria bacterium]|nr:outer membrane protein assembly factor BamE [Alphaproteobacteria bacterium]